jgi:1A family penicillin-binding protein
MNKITSKHWPSFVRELSRRKPRTRSQFIELIAAIVGIIFFLCAGIVLIWFATLKVPSITAFETRRVPESTKIYDRTGKILLYDVHGSIRRTKVPLNEISLYLRNATIAIEDPDFYQHHGVLPKAIARAIYTDITTGELLRGQGGSTITQQVVKNTLLTTDKTITRKVKEWILALKLERAFTKDQILEVYFNEAPYGGTLYGAEEASQSFFGKDAKDLSLAESAYLAAIPQAPTYYSPFGNHREGLENRKNLVLERMLQRGFATKAEYDVAKAEKVVFLDQASNGIKAPHFVFYVREYLEAKYGADQVQSGGLKVITSLDYNLQQKAEEIVKRRALSNASQFNASNAALVAVDPKTGQILTMVGSRDYFDEKIDGKFNVATAYRQPGSSFKPFIYATAFGKGYTEKTVLFDLKTQFSTSCAPNFFETTDICYSPDNYDNNFLGPMTLKDALAQSRNIPAVKLLYLAGIKESIATALRMGITSLADAGTYGLTLVLGGGEVSLLEMTSAYGVFANEGVRHSDTVILRIEDGKGTVLEEYKDTAGAQVISPEVTHMISDILSDDVARTPEFGVNSALVVPGHHVAVKTGTTNDYRDTWIIGYTPTLSVGSWAGNNDNSPMVKKIAGFIVAPMWNEFMQFALASTTDAPFPAPPAEDPAMKPPFLGVWNQNGVVHDILQYVNKDDPLGPPPSNPQSDGQYNYWEYPVALWAGQQPNLGSSSIPSNLPNFPSVPTPIGNAPYVPSVFTITSPSDGSAVKSGSLITVTVEGEALSQTRHVAYYINGVSIGSSSSAPYSISFMPSEPGTVIIRAVTGGDSGGYSSQVAVTVE